MPGRSWIWSIAAVLLASCPAVLALRAAEPPKLSASERQALLTEHDRIWEGTQQKKAAGKLAEALAGLEKVLAIERQVYGNVHQELLGTLRYLALWRREAEDLAGAQSALSEELAISIQLFGKDHWQTTNVREELATGEIITRLPADRRRELAAADALMAQTIRLQNEDQSAQALPLIEKVWEIRRRLLGEKKLESELALGTLGLTLLQLGDFARAEAYLLQAVSLTKETLGEGHPNYASNLNNLATLYKARGEYAKAEPLYLRMLAIRKKSLGENDPQYAEALSNLAIFYRERAEYSRAEPLVKEAIAIWKKAYGETHPQYAKGLNNLAVLYEATGNYAEALRLCTEASAIRKGALGAGHPQFAISLYNLAGIYDAAGNFAEAEPRYREALQILKAGSHQFEPMYAEMLNGLAHCYYHAADYTQAERLFLEAQSLIKQALGEAHPSYGMVCNNLAGLYKTIGDYPRAEAQCRKALEIYERAFGKAHPSYAIAQDNLAALLKYRGAYEQAIALEKESLETTAKTLGNSHPSYAARLSNLAFLYELTRDYASAESLLLRAQEINGKTLGESHLYYARTLHSLGELYRSRREADKAEEYFRRACQIALTNLDAAAAAQSERQQLAILAQTRRFLDSLLSLALEHQSVGSEAFSQVLAWQGTVLSRQRAIRAASSQPEQKALADKLRITAAELARRAITIPTAAPADEWKSQLAALSREKEALEGELAKASESIRSALVPASVASLAAAIPQAAALVDFLEYDHGYWGDRQRVGGWFTQRRLAAFVVDRQGDAKFVDLGSVGPIRQAIDAWRSDNGKSDPAKLAAQKLKELVWLPVARHLAGATTVLLSLDGELGKFPFAALPGNQAGSYLIEDFALAIVPSPQTVIELLSHPPPPRPSGNVLVVADVNYDSRSAAVNERPRKQFAARAMRDEGEAFVPLSGTRGELATIQKLYRENFGAEGLTAVQGSAATQEAFIREAMRHSYLHVATHGFFAAAKFKSALDRPTQPGMSGDTEIVTDQSLAGYHPGLLSGLALAGANKPMDEDDGILTAEEVASLNLSGVSLATLSACETGLGKAAGGEGLLGLERAFHTAGARTVIGSLWKVDDVATRDLMERFYENLWNKDMGKLPALREAQLWMLKERGARGLKEVADDRGQETGNKRLPPYFWAAFVLSGDWR